MTTGTVLFYTGISMVAVSVIAGIPAMLVLRYVNRRIRRQIYGFSLRKKLWHNCGWTIVSELGAENQRGSILSNPFLISISSRIPTDW